MVPGDQRVSLEVSKWLDGPSVNVSSHFFAIPELKRSRVDGNYIDPSLRDRAVERDSPRICRPEPWCICYVQYAASSAS